ncbi:FecR family protein [Sphingomonas aracearum]|uniref:DUF4880 domain-containing protein n=1 Tax=Sphingomonas aracearum TaxID=2283317 RepID=A0A369VT50_9SPHN|nr:FecR domain-containing protein [Sphingomonas aracearum]RDE05586.1 DUF4880 domain-containing protein [Sphingomonas aracearum]
MTRQGDNPEPVHADDTAAAQAATWLARYQLGTLDEAAFDAWRTADPAHAVAFARAWAMWDRFEAQPASAAQPPLPVRPARRELLRAACAVLAVGIVAAGTSVTRAYAWSSATTALGENKRLRLPDGSMAALNTDSRLSWRFSDRERTFWVERGEVSFALRDGPRAIVQDDGKAIRLSPGRFNLRRRSEAVDLLVLAGSASVTDAGGRLVRADPRLPSLLVSQSTAVVRPATSEQVAGTIAWQSGEILFQDATLGSAVEEYNRFLTRKIVIVDRELASIPVGGRFTSTDPTAFLRAISAGLGVRVSQSNSAYLLTR